MKIPQIGGRELEVYKLYKAVTKRGGLKVVSSNKLWKVYQYHYGLGNCWLISISCYMYICLFYIKKSLLKIASFIWIKIFFW